MIYYYMLLHKRGVLDCCIPPTQVCVGSFFGYPRRGVRKRVKRIGMITKWDRNIRAFYKSVYSCYSLYVLYLLQVVAYYTYLIYIVYIDPYCAFKYSILALDVEFLYADV